MEQVVALPGCIAIYTAFPAFRLVLGVSCIELEAKQEEKRDHVEM